MTNSKTTILVVDDDPDVGAGVAAALARNDRLVIVCGDRTSAELVIERVPVTHIVADVRMSDPLSYDGLRLRAHASTHAPFARFVLMSGAASEGVRAESAMRGTHLLSKPFDVDQLTALFDVPPGGPADDDAVINMPLLRSLLHGRALGMAYQPIVRIDDGRPIGFEALVRVGGSLLPDPEMLFELARRSDKTTELNLLCLRRAIEGGAELARFSDLFINLDATVVESGRGLETLLEAATVNQVPLSRIVLELTEGTPFSSSQRGIDAVAEIRAAGVRIAIDDIGEQCSHLPLTAQLQPAFLKIGQKFGRGFEGDESKTRAVCVAERFARAHRVAVILEGIETGATAAAARNLGITLGQGFHFGKPMPQIPAEKSSYLH